jgi:hypothetical protein
MRRSIAARNAASVLPDPVGARSSVERPATIGGHPLACAAVGAAKDASNQRRTAGRKRSRGSTRRVTGTFSPFGHSEEQSDEESLSGAQEIPRFARDDSES